MTALISFKCQRYGKQMAKRPGMRIIPVLPRWTLRALPGRWRLSDIRTWKSNQTLLLLPRYPWRRRKLHERPYSFPKREDHPPPPTKQIFPLDTYSTSSRFSWAFIGSIRPKRSPRTRQSPPKKRNSLSSLMKVTWHYCWLLEQQRPGISLL